MFGTNPTWCKALGNYSVEPPAVQQEGPSAVFSAHPAKRDQATHRASNPNIALLERRGAWATLHALGM